MAVQRIRDEGQELSVPTGKVLGIVDTQEQLDQLIQALQPTRCDKVEALCGDEGRALLERIDNFFFSDMEDRVLQWHIDALKAGKIVVAIQAPTDRVNEVVELASQHGARRLVHFGQWRVTWHTK